jgi:hypothetical protein
MVSDIPAWDGNVANLFSGVYCTDTKLHVETVGIGLVLCVCSTQAGMDAQIWLIGNSGPTTPHLSA